MKTRIFLIAIASAMTAATTLVFAADRIDPAQLPLAVKRSLDEAAGGEPVKQITVRRTRDRIVYDVELERKNAPNPHVRIGENGEVVSDTRTSPSTDVWSVNPDSPPGSATLPRLQLEALPRPVQQTIQREAAGREIAVIHEDSIGGRKAYAVQFRERGRNPWVYLDEDGTILRPAEKPPALGLGTMLSDAPTPVQQTITREIGDGEIQRIDKETGRGEPDTYKVSIKDARGTYQLRVSADGRVLESTRGAERPARRG